MLSTVLDVVPRILPFRAADPSWRFGAYGIVFGALLTPVLGLALAMGAAVVLRRRRTLVVLSVISLVSAGLLLVGSVAFFLTYRTVLPAAGSPSRAAVSAAAWAALITAGLAAAAAGWMGCGGWIAARREASRELEERRDRAQVVTGGR